MRKRTWLWLFAAAAVITALRAAPVRAGDAEQLVVRVEKVYLKDQASQWVLAYEKPTDLDLTDEASEIAFKNEGQLPEGQYWNVKLVLSETLRVKGFSGGRYTKQGGRVRIGGDVGTASAIDRLNIEEFVVESPTVTSDGSQAGLVEVTLDLDQRDRDKVSEIYGRRNFPSPANIKKGSEISVRLGLTPLDTVRLATVDYFAGIRSPESLYFLPSKDVSEISIKVGAESRVLTSEVLEWSF